MEAACAVCGRDPSTVTLLPVTKTHGAWAAEFAFRAGLSAVGENRVQEAEAKKREVTAPVRWELIGSLQSNKAKLAVSLFDRIQSVDRSKLVGVLNRHCQEAGRGALPVLVEVNAGEDPAKHGVEPEAVGSLVEAVIGSDSLVLQGFMTIAPLEGGSDAARRCFARLREIRDRMEVRFGRSFPELSMGMSGDLEEAIAEGSTMIRVGTALFGSRD